RHWCAAGDAVHGAMSRDEVSGLQTGVLFDERSQSARSSVGNDSRCSNSRVTLTSPQTRPHCEQAATPGSIFAPLRIDENCDAYARKLKGAVGPMERPGVSSPMTILWLLQRGQAGLLSLIVMARRQRVHKSAAPSIPSGEDTS